MIKGTEKLNIDIKINAIFNSCILKNLIKLINKKFILQKGSEYEGDTD